MPDQGNKRSITVTTLESFFASIGLLWQRLHIISVDTVQTDGVRCEWVQNLSPVDERTVPAGELVELHATLDDDHSIADTSVIRFDVLEFDWLFGGGFDDPLASLKPAGAPDPSGSFTIHDRVVSEATTTDGLPTLRDVVDDYRVRHADDFERGILVVTDATSGATDVIAWWRAEFVSDEDAPSLYFVAEIPERRSSSTVPLRVAPPMPGVNLRVTGEVHDTNTAAFAVPNAVITLAGPTARTTGSGLFVLDARLLLGASTLTVTRPGIETRTLTVSVTERADHGIDVVVTDEQAARVAAETLQAGAGPQDFVRVDLSLSALVHRVTGRVQWPATWTPAAPTRLRDRIVYALKLDAGAALPQRPRTSREWEALRNRPGVERSRATGADGAFDLPFVDLRAGAQHLVWVDGPDPRAAGTRANDVLVRTVTTPLMRRLAFAQGALTPERIDRRAVDSTYNLMTGDLAGATDVLRVVEATPGNLQVQRPGRANPGGFDATPVADVDTLDVDDSTKRVSGLVLEALPLVPVFETADREGERTRWAVRSLRARLDLHYPRGHLLGDLRWVLDARRTPAAVWNDASACELLERTLLTHPLLTPARINDADWPWWRADAVSAADCAEVALGANATFAGRTLVAELVPVLKPAVPRLLGLFDHRYAHVTPGHGVFAQPPELTGNPAHYVIRTKRDLWAGTDPQGATVTQNYGGEDESVAAMGMHLQTITDANGMPVTVARESRDPTRLGIVQSNGQFAAVDPHLFPDYPRLWQQNSYYWIVVGWDPQHPGNELVRGNASNSAAANAIDSAAINRRLAAVSADAGNAARPLDAWVAIHTNGAQHPNTGAVIRDRRGFDVMYLDVRPTAQSPAPGAAGYQEANTLDQDAAQRMSNAIGQHVTIRNRGVSTYWSVGGNEDKELTSTTHHWRDGTVSHSTRTAVVTPGFAEVTFPTGQQAADFPLAFIELGFHTNPDDALCLGQEWFRYASGTGIAAGIESIIGRHSRPVQWADMRALLARTYGRTAAVAGLVADANPMTPADATQWLRTVSGSTAASVATTNLADVVAAIEIERDGPRDEALGRNTVTRTLLAQRISDALAPVAGWTADAAQADDRARAALGPVLRALGAASNAVPAIGGLPSGDRPVIRLEAAAALSGALGLPTADLATVTAPVNGVTVLAAANPEAPEAFVAAPTLTATVEALADLRRVDVWHLAAVRVTDDRNRPARPVVGATVLLALDMAGTAWPGPADDVEIVVSRGGATVVTLECATRTAATVTSRPWRVPTGSDPFVVSVRVDSTMLTPTVQVSPQ